MQAIAVEQAIKAAPESLLRTEDKNDKCAGLPLTAATLCVRRCAEQGIIKRVIAMPMIADSSLPRFAEARRHGLAHAVLVKHAQHSLVCS